MKPSRVKRKMDAGQPAVITLMHILDQSLFDMAGMIGFDGIWMDMEHHGYSLETAQALMRAFRAHGGDIIARCANREFMRMGRMLEIGASGIMYPRCADAAEAAEVVKWAKFPPRGQRGIDSGNVDMPYSMGDIGDYVRQANEQTFIVAQIEDEASLANAEAIGAVEGVDVLMLGPGDFSVQIGVPGQIDHPRVQKAAETIAAAARNTGKHWGMPFPTVEAVVKGLEMGARFVIHQSDMGLIRDGLCSIRTALEPLGLKFERSSGVHES